jgi:hypothetical protein
MLTIHKLQSINSNIENQTTCCFSTPILISEETQIMYAIYWDEDMRKKRPFTSISIDDIVSFICINTNNVITKWFTQPEARKMGMGGRLLHHVSIHHPQCKITLPIFKYRDPVLALCLRFGFKKYETTLSEITLVK